MNDWLRSLHDELATHGGAVVRVVIAIEPQRIGSEFRQDAEPQELLTRMTSAVVSQLDPKTSDLPAAAEKPYGNGSPTAAEPPPAAAGVTRVL